MRLRAALALAVFAAATRLCAAPWAVVADPAFSRDRIRAAMGADVRFFSAKELPAIRAFVARGGKVAVAYSGDAALAQFMGVRPGAWRKVDVAALGNGGRIRCNYRTGCAFVPGIPAGNPRHARVVANLLDRNLRDTGLPGIVETDRGVWYAHAIPPAPMGPGKLTPLPQALPVRAVWSDGRALVPGGWHVQARRLAASGFNTVFLRSSADGFDSIVRECRAAGLKVHAWVVCFEAGKRRPDRAQDRAAVIAEVLRFAAKGVDGVQLDYIRYPSGELSTPAKRKAGQRVLNEFMRTLSREFRRRAKKGRQLSAAVYPIPSTQGAVGQDPSAWLRAGHVDFISPMCYSSSAAEFAKWLDANASAYGAVKLVVGVGSGANESRLNAAGIGAQVRAAASRRVRGVSLYALDAELSARLK